MTLIFGGAYQGKLDFARELCADGTVGHCTDSGAVEPEADIICDYHLLVLSLLRRGVDPCAYTRERLPSLAGKFVLCEDISSGVVPVDPEMRAWREAVGRCMGILAREAGSVYRVFCGIGTKIK